MSSFIFRRIIQTLVVVFIVTFISFCLLHIMPGDPAVTMLGMDAPQEQIDALRTELWLDRPFLVQYGHWLYNAVHGDLGNSIFYRDSVASIFATRLPITGYLSLVSLIISTILGILAGIICAVRRGSILDQIISVLSNMGIAIPIFWLGILGLYFFGLELKWLPIGGWTSPLDDFGDSMRKAVMPVILMAIPSIAVVARQTRSSMLEIIRQDYIRTAIAKGLRERVVVYKHALKNALIPVVTIIGLQVRILVGGSVLVENVFNIPGMGRLLVSSALNKDFLVVQGSVLMIGLVICLANLLVDISYGWLDPRIRYE